VNILTDRSTSHLDKAELAVEAQKFTPRIKIPVLDQSTPAEILTIKYATPNGTSTVRTEDSAAI
jgi:hypothetical protein